MEYPEWKHDLQKFDFQMYAKPLKIVLEYYKEHLRLDTEDGRLRPAKVWFVVRGLLISAIQTFGAMCALLAEKQPRPYLVQGGILNRSLLEGLGNLLAVFEAPTKRTEVLERSAYKNQALRVSGKKEVRRRRRLVVLLRGVRKMPRSMGGRTEADP